MASISRQTAIKVVYWNAVAAVLIFCLFAATVARRLHAYDKLIVDISREYAIDPRLVSSLIWRESRFEAAAVGDKGEVGLMQVTETAGKEWAEADHYKLFTKRDLFKPEINIRAGTWYLVRAIDAWSDREDPLPYALAEYNAGRSNALRWARISGENPQAFIENITYPTTRAYVTDILERYRGRV